MTGSRFKSATVSDPYVVAQREDGTIALFVGDTMKGTLSEVTVPLSEENQVSLMLAPPLSPFPLYVPVLTFACHPVILHLVRHLHRYLGHLHCPQGRVCRSGQG